MSGARSSVVPLGIALAVLAAAGLFFLMTTHGPSVPADIASSSPYRFDSAAQAWYQNEAPRFSFRIPEGFAVPNQPIAAGKGEEVVLVNKAEDMALIAVYPLAEGAAGDLAPANVRASIPDDGPTQFSETKLGDGTAALSFHTVSPDWNGDGVALWFVHDGYLYELSTAASSAELLELLRQTFYFPKAR